MKTIRNLILLVALIAIARVAHFEDGSGRIDVGQLATISYCIPHTPCWD